MARQIVVDIVGDAKNFNKAADSAVNKANTLNGKLRSVGKGIAVGAGIAAFSGLTLGAAALVGVLGDADRAFREDEVSQKLLAQSLKNNIPDWKGNTKAVEDYASAQAKLGFADDEVRDSIAQITGVTHDLAEAMDLNSLAQDLARAKGIDLATAADIVTKAYEGNGRALKALGIDIGDAKTSAELLAAIFKNVDGAAKTYAETSEGKLTVSQVKVGEAMEKIGKTVDKLALIVLPGLADAFVRIVDGIDKVIGAIEKLVGWVQSVIEKFRTATRVAGDFFNINQGRGGGGEFGPPPSQAPRDYLPTYTSPIAPIRTNVPVFHSGGIVPGMPGADVLTMLQAGERVLPRTSVGSGAAELTFNFYGPVYGDGPFLDDLTNRIAQRLRYSTGT